MLRASWAYGGALPGGGAWGGGWCRLPSDGRATVTPGMGVGGGARSVHCELLPAACYNEVGVILGTLVPQVDAGGDRIRGGPDNYSFTCSCAHTFLCSSAIAAAHFACRVEGSALAWWPQVAGGGRR